jgi:DNA-binding NarL/FixJ family response regulator
MLLKKRKEVVIATNSGGIDGIIRQFLRRVTDEDELVTVHNEASLNEAMKQYRPHYLILENTFKHSATFELVRTLARKDNDLKIIIFTLKNCEKPEVCRFAFCGAHSYVDLREEQDVAVKVLHTVLKGGRFFPEWAKEMMEDFAENVTTEKGKLTKRELEVLRLILTGLTCQDISAILGIAFPTVRIYRDSILKKIDGHNVIDMLKHAFINNLVCVDDFIEGLTLAKQEGYSLC